MASLASPFVAALPAPHHLFFEYDADGDAIMTDAATGLPITYAASGRRARSYSDDSDADSRPSKRSRSSSEDDGDAAAPAPAALRAAPPAPKKAPAPAAAAAEDDGDGDADYNAARNLAEAMAEAVLHGEPAPAPAPSAVAEGDADGDAAPASASPPGGEGDVEEDWEQQDWMLSATVKDLALRLDFRHPRVLLHFLRFVESYNALAPEGEEIHLPPFKESNFAYIIGNLAVKDVDPEHAEEVNELIALVRKHTVADVEACPCRSCNNHESDYDSDGDDSDSLPY